MRLFGTAGIRLIYPREINPEIAFRIGNATGRLGLSKKAYVVHDTRTTSPLISIAFATGLMSTGVKTWICGVAPTPVAGFLARKYSALGVSVTASHNPPEYNGVKLYDPEGFEFTRDLERKVESNFDSLGYVEWDTVGDYAVFSEAIGEYYSELLRFIGEINAKWKPTIVIDCANGAAYNVSPLIVRSIGGKPFAFNCNPDGYFPIRAPEPRRDVLESMLNVYRSVNPVVILAHDGDADRLAVLDPVYGFIRQDRILALYAKKILEERKGHVVVSIDTGLVIEDVVYDNGGTIERYPLGKTHERVKELGLKNVIMAGEPWKLIDTRWGPWVDGILQVALITKAIVESGKSLSKVIEEERIPDYPWDRRSYKIEPLEIRDIVYEEVASEMLSLLGDPQKVTDIDGYRFEYKDRSWILLRKSGTEPKLRIYAEALSKERLTNMVEKTEKLIKEKVEKHGGSIVEITYG